MKRLLTALVICALALTGCEIEDVERWVDDARVVARVGVLADTGVDGRGKMPNLRRVFGFFRQREVDAVAIVGQVTKGGLVSQETALRQLFGEIFMGTKTRLIVAPGDYAVNGFEFALAAKRPYAKCEKLTFYGGRKLALTDELCIYPRDSRVVCAGSMQGVEIPAGFSDKAQRDRAARMIQGLLVSAYADNTVIRRFDFTDRRADEVADPWVVDADGRVADPPEKAEFWDDATVQVLPGFLNGKPIYTVRWSSVQKRHTGARARWYEVTVAFADAPEAVFMRRDVLSDGFAFSEARDAGPVKCVFRSAEMPASTPRHPSVVFAVTPIGCYGARGRTIVSDPVPLAR